MPDLPAPTRRSVAAPLHSRQSLKNVGSCMGAFSQMFHLNRMVGGSKKFLATPDGRTQTQGRKTACLAVENQMSLRKDHTQESEIGIDLRRILDAKQEPFVLQDVIWEKRHPMRTKSSRELKFEMIEIPRKSQSSKRSKSRDSRKHVDEGLDDLKFATCHGSEGSSSALVMGSHIPAESMVALPSNQGAPHVRKTRSSSSKLPPTGMSPVKSPNKRVLLMEAATKILEGSNRRVSKAPSSSVRSLLREIDGSKHAHEPSKSKEIPLRNPPLVLGYSDKQKFPLQKDMVSLEKKQLEGKHHSHCSIDKSFSFGKQLRQSFSSSLMDSFEMPDEEVLMIMQSRLFPSGETSSAAGELTQLATTADNHNVMPHVNRVQGPDNYLSGVDSTGKETFTTCVNVANACIERSYVRSADEQTHWDAESVMTSEIAGRHHSQTEMQSMVENRKDLDLATHVDPSTELSEHEFVDSLGWKTCPLRHSQAGISMRSQALLIPDTDGIIDAASGGTCEPSIGDVDAVHTCTISGLDSDGLVKSFSTNICTPIVLEEMGCQEITSENVPAPLLLLCNYSWWTGEGVRADFPTPTNDEISNDYAGYDSPIATTRSPHAVKIFEERKQGANDEEESSTSPDHSYVEEEFQQSSPVSVLDPVYENCPGLCKPFDYFDEARQKFLDSVRRYEMLANMDLDMLIKINEENLYHEFDEEESDASSFNESWGGDVADVCAVQPPHVPLMMGSPDYALSRYDGGFLNARAEQLSSDGVQDPLCEVIEDDLYILSDGDMYTQSWQELELVSEDVSTSDLIMDVSARLSAEAETRRCNGLLDYSSEPSDLNASTGPTWQSSSRTSLSRDAFGEAEKLTVLGIVNAILQKDVKASSWSGFNEEVEVMEMELESSLYAALMQELLSDLLLQ